MKTSRILVATDFSNEAYNALFYVTKLLEKQKCIIYLLNVNQSPSNNFFSQKEKVDDLNKESKERLTATLHKIQRDQNNDLHDFQTISRQGSLEEVIIRTIVDRKIDLLVMGNKGKTGAKEIFMGGYTVKVIRSLKQCPLLAVPKESEYKRPEHIAFISDFKKGCSLQTIKPLLKLAKAVNAHIKLLHISEEGILSSVQNSNKGLLEISLQEISHDFTTIFKYTDKAQVIDHFIKTNLVQLFSLVYTKKSIIERFFKVPVIMDLSIYSNIPFLILPNKD